MRLKSFQIRNYKSVVDSGICRLSDVDNIMVLAGQNESGKSTILQALRDFSLDKTSTDNLREEDDKFPEITCTYHWRADDQIDLASIVSDYDIPQIFESFIRGLRTIAITKYFDSEGNAVCALSDEEQINEINEICAKYNAGIAGNIEASNKAEASETEEALYPDEVSEVLAAALNDYLPTIVFFDDFCDLLPDTILIKELKGKDATVKGLQAVRNIQTILGADFSKLDALNDTRVANIQSQYHETITTQFNEKWKQRISEGDGAKIHVIYNQGKAAGASYLSFFIETRKGEFIAPRKRSQGFKWFLSFFLHLKAESMRSKSFILLFDEPGMHLHSKAQSDMISVFEELSTRHQIIYSTHSPYLIDPKKLHRLRLVLNTKKHGTTVEKITTNKIENQKEALKPIVDAIGLDIASPFAVGKKKNVIVEGISDYYYFHSMRQLAGRSIDYAFLPAMGASSSHLLMELCIGWGLNWIIVFDDKGAIKEFNKIKKNFFNDDEQKARERIYILKDCDGIEDVFTPGDLKLVNPEVDFGVGKKNSDLVVSSGGKELFARMFGEKVSNGEITIDKISKSAQKRFKDVFDFIEAEFSKLP